MYGKLNLIRNYPQNRKLMASLIQNLSSHIMKEIARLGSYPTFINHRKDLIPYYIPYYIPCQRQTGNFIPNCSDVAS